MTAGSHVGRFQLNP
uniref:Uncharacterized protein n=1 Tax=Arundo donax TaxID=35708 RepID=A0A0A9GSY6_ARUDO